MPKGDHNVTKRKPCGKILIFDASPPPRHTKFWSHLGTIFMKKRRKLRTKNHREIDAEKQWEISKIDPQKEGNSIPKVIQNLILRDSAFCRKQWLYVQCLLKTKIGQPRNFLIFATCWFYRKTHRAHTRARNYRFRFVDFVVVCLKIVHVFRHRLCYVFHVFLHWFWHHDWCIFMNCHVFSASNFASILKWFFGAEWMKNWCPNLSKIWKGLKKGR